MNNDQQIVCIVTHPRSGGTVLQRVLHSMPETLFRGENNGCIVDICNLIFKVHHGQKYFSENLKMRFDDEKSPIYGLDLINTDTIIFLLRDFYLNEIIKSNNQYKYIGWKECWFDPFYYGRENTKNHLKVLQKIFPNIKIIFNLRNPEDTSKSPGMHGRKEGFEMIKEYNESYKYFQDINLFNGNSILIYHEDWKENPEYLYNQLKSLNLPVDINSVKHILSEELTHLRFLKD
jgi:hypothetical protein